MSLPFVGSIDQGTTSSRFIVFDSKGETVVKSQKEINISNPEPGWVEEDPEEMLTHIKECIEDCCQQLEKLGFKAKDVIKAIGVTNQRETTILWNKATGKPYYNAIVWSDNRTSSLVEEYAKRSGKNALRDLTGLPLSSYFSATKIRWLLDHLPHLSEDISSGNCLFGTVDSWLLWNLTGLHITDVTNASRTMLMNLQTLQWDETLCKFFDIPSSILPTIRSSSENYGPLNTGSLKGIPISGCLGDQQASLVGQHCFLPGEIKNTYGTGCFILLNTGEKIVQSTNGLLTTVAYQLSPDSPPVYALEGSVATAGSVIQWLRDRLKLISDAKEFDKLAGSVTSTGGVYFVPAFSGLLAPYWQESARGTIVGISQYTTNAHICLAVLEAITFQTEEILEAMRKDIDFQLECLKIDGGVTNNPKLAQLQSDISGITVSISKCQESTALGAAIVAGLSCGVYSVSEFKELAKTASFQPSIPVDERLEKLALWRKTVFKSFDP